MKFSIVTVLTTLLLVSACATSAPTTKTDLDDLLQMEIIAPPVPKPAVEEKKTPVPKPVRESKTDLAAFLGTDAEETAAEPICSATDLRPLTKPVQLEVSSFELSDDSEGTEAAGGAHVLRTCCDVREYLPDNDSRYPAECRAQVARNP